MAAGRSIQRITQGVRDAYQRAIGMLRDSMMYNMQEGQKLITKTGEGLRVRWNEEENTRRTHTTSKTNIKSV
jgi:hypothetical protein